MTTAYTYYTVEEFNDEINRLAKPDFKRLELIAAKFLRMYGLRDEPVDLIQDAVERVYSGSRHLPKEIGLIGGLGQVMASVAEGRKKGRDWRESSVGGSVELDSIGQAASHASPEEELTAAQTMEQINCRFQEDKDVLSLINANAKGMKSKQIIDALFDGNKKTYEATRKRLSRGLASMTEGVQP